MRLIIVRHGETEENMSHIVQGHRHGKLSKRGLKQAKAIGLKLKNERIDAIFSSDLRRTRHTAREIARFHKVPVHYAKELRERHAGIFQGRHADHFSAAVDASGVPSTEFRPEGGESIIDLRNRVRKFASKLYKRHSDKTVLIVTHGGVARALLYIYNRVHLRKVQDIKPVNTGVLIIEVRGRNGKIIKDAMFVEKG